MSNLPQGWTDEMNISVGAEHILHEVVEYIFVAAVRHDTPAEITRHLCNNFGLTQADAELALDRFHGGVVRAATGRADNCPVKENDPIAWMSFQKCSKAPNLIAARIRHTRAKVMVATVSKVIKPIDDKSRLHSKPLKTCNRLQQLTTKCQALIHVGSGSTQVRRSIKRRPTAISGRSIQA